MILPDPQDGRVSVYALSDELGEGFVADEVALHLSELTGVRHERPRRVGGVSEAEAPCLALEVSPELGREAHDCRVEDGRVRIRGGDARGVYYGALALFEALGFRWYAPGEDGTVTPPASAAEVPDDWRSAGTPSLDWRGYHICGTGFTREGEPIGHFDHETALWMARNRMNFKPIHNDEYDEVTPLLREVGLSPLAFGHSYSGWMPNEEFEAHPELFAEIAGKRRPGGQPCLSNPETLRRFVERIVAFMDAHPDLPIVSIAPNDGYKFCQCAGCAAMDSAEDREKAEVNRRNHVFSARVAAEVRKLRPDRQVSTLSYCNYLEPSDDVPPEANLAVSMCITRAQTRALDDPESPSNRTFRERLDRWLAKTGGVFWSAYYLSYGGTFPRPYEGQIARTIRYLVKRGVRGLKSEVTPGRYDRWQSAVFYLYLVARLAYDAGTEPDALLQDFCERYYGPAAEPCIESHRLHSAVVERFDGEMRYVEAPLLPTLYTDDEIERLNALGGEAARAVEGADPAFGRRLEPLLRQAGELARSRGEVLRAEAESAPLACPHWAEGPTFEDFDDLVWTEQRMRPNLLPYPEPSRFATAWTDEALWVCFRLGEPDVAASVEADKVREGAWGRSLVDCFFCPDPASGFYYQVVVNVVGGTYVARCRGREWNAGYTMDLSPQVRHLARRWELILRLPFTSLEAGTPAPGGRWRLAVNRGQQCRSPRVLGGWPMGGSWHRVDTMGELVFRREP